MQKGRGELVCSDSEERNRTNVEGLAKQELVNRRQPRAHSQSPAAAPPSSGLKSSCRRSDPSRDGATRGGHSLLPVRAGHMRRPAHTCRRRQTHRGRLPRVRSIPHQLKALLPPAHTCFRHKVKLTVPFAQFALLIVERPIEANFAMDCCLSCCGTCAWDPLVELLLPAGMVCASVRIFDRCLSVCRQRLIFC